MHRGRQLPPLNKRDEASTLLKELRSELTVLEKTQKAVEDEKSAQLNSAKSNKKTKSVLAKRLLEQHRMLALQRHHDEAVEHAARVHDFNDAMREQAQVHIHRIVMQREFVRNTMPSQTALYAEHANLELPTTGALVPKDARPSSADKLRATSVSIRKEMGSMKTLLRDLLNSGQRAGTRPADRTLNPSSGSGLVLSIPQAAAPATVSHDPLLSEVMTARHPISQVDIDAFQAKALERLARLEEAELKRKRDDLLRSAGTVGPDEAIVDGRVVRENAEANQRALRSGTQVADRSLNQSTRVRIVEASKEESRELQIIAQHEKQQHALAEQRGYLRRLRERLALLEEAEPSPAPAKEPQTVANRAIVPEQKTREEAASHAAARRDAGESPPTANAVQETAPAQSAAAVEPGDRLAETDRTSAADAVDQESAAVDVEPGEPNASTLRPKRSRVLELRALCAELERSGQQPAALEEAQARLILALHREIVEAESVVVDNSAVATIVNAFCRALQSKCRAIAKDRYLNDAAVILQNALRIPGAKERARLRACFVRRVRQWYPAASIAVAAAITLQAWARGHRTRRPRTGARFADRLAAYRALLSSTRRHEAALMVQTQVRRHLASKRCVPRKQAWRQFLEEEKRHSDLLFNQEADEGIW